LLTGQFEKLEIQFSAENIPLSYSRNGVGCLLLGSHIGSFEVLRSYAGSIIEPVASTSVPRVQENFMFFNEDDCWSMIEKSSPGRKGCKNFAWDKVFI
jgi:predicted LPLAT superfamily acyltransferase